MYSFMRPVEVIYTYTFGIEVMPFAIVTPAFAELMKSMDMTFYTEKSETEFNAFRAQLVQDGIELIGIERRVCTAPEAIE